MGYQGTSVPGGVPQIYSQYTNALRAIYNIVNNKELKPRLKLLTGNTYADNEITVFNECPSKMWPCNLCKKDKKYYSKLNESLSKYLKLERSRQKKNITNNEGQVESLENIFNENRFYKNSSWACSGLSPDTLPFLPDKSMLPKSGKLLFSILFMPTSPQLSDYQNLELRVELLHQLSNLRFSLEELIDLKSYMNEKETKGNMLKLKHFLTQNGSDNSLYERYLRDYLNVSQKLECKECIENIDKAEVYKLQDTVNRVAFAGSLEPDFGKYKYIMTLNDSSAEVNQAVATKLSISLGEDLYLLALNKDEKTAINAMYTIEATNNNTKKNISINALKSKYPEVRRIAWNRLVPDQYSSDYDEIILSAIKGPFKEEFINSLSGKLTQNNSSEVFLVALNNIKSEYSIRPITDHVLPTHSNEVFKKIFSLPNVHIQIIRDTAQKLNSYHSDDVYTFALSHKDYYVRSGAARRLNEKNKFNLFSLALNDTDIRIRWAAAGSLNVQSDISSFKLALSKNQKSSTRIIAATRIFEGIDQSIINIVLNDSNNNVVLEAKRALGMER